MELSEWHYKQLKLIFTAPLFVIYKAEDMRCLRKVINIKLYNIN
jgi:hypothetical protein